MIPNNSIYEAGFKSQFFTIVLISGFLIFGAWSLTKLIISISQKEENQKKITVLFQKVLDLLDYYLDDLKYIDNAIKFFRKNFIHKQVYESVAVEDGLLPPYVEEKPKTIYCAEYYQKVLEKQKSNKKLFSEVTIFLTLSNGLTINYIPKYPWYWDGVELFTGIQPNAKKVYDPNYLSPDYVPKIKFTMEYETQNVNAGQEANWIIQNQQSIKSSETSDDEEKKLTTLLLTKNNSLSSIKPSNTPLIFNMNEFENNSNTIQNQKNVPVKDDTTYDFEVSVEKENKNLLVSISPNISLTNSNSKENKLINTEFINSLPKTQIHTDTKIKRHLKLSKSTSHLKKEKGKIGSLKKSTSLPNLQNNKDKNQQKQKFLKKLKHKKQPKIIYPSIPVNPNLSFVPLYKKNDSKIESRVKHSDMENTYKKLNCSKSL